MLLRLFARRNISVKTGPPVMHTYFVSKVGSTKPGSSGVGTAERKATPKFCSGALVDRLETRCSKSISQHVFSLTKAYGVGSRMFKDRSNLAADTSCKVTDPGAPGLRDYGVLKAKLFSRTEMLAFWEFGSVGFGAEKQNLGFTSGLRKATGPKLLRSLRRTVWAVEAIESAAENLNHILQLECMELTGINHPAWNFTFFQKS